MKREGNEKNLSRTSRNPTGVAKKAFKKIPNGLKNDQRIKTSNGNIIMDLHGLSNNKNPRKSFKSASSVFKSFCFKAAQCTIYLTNCIAAFA